MSWPGRLGFAVLVAHLAFSPIIFCRGALEPFEFAKVSLLKFTAILLAALGFAALVRRPVATSLRAWLQGLRHDPVALGVLCLLASAAASTVASISPRTSWQGAPESYAGFTTALAYAVLFFFTRWVCRDDPARRKLLAAPLVGAAAASGYALVQLAGWDPLAWGEVSTVGGFVRPFGTMGHPNFLGVYLVMVLPLAATLAVRAADERRWLQCLCGVLVSLLAVVAIVATLSRGAWLALLGAGVVLAVGWFLAGRRRLAAGVAVLLVAGAGVAVLASVAGMRGGVVERLRSLGDSPARAHLWRAGLRLFRARPVLGWGLDAFQLAFPKERTPEYWQVEWGITPLKAHNEVVHTLATQGLVGATALLVMVGGLVLAGRRAWLQAGAKERLLLVAVIAGVVGFGIQSLFSFTVAALGALFLTFAAILSASSRPQVEPCQEAAPGRLRLTFQLGGWGLALVLVYQGVVVPLSATRACATGERLLTEAPDQALASFERAVELCPDEAVYWSRLGAAEEAVARRAPSPEWQRRPLLRARQAFDAAVRLEPKNSCNRINLGRVLATLALRRVADPAAAFAEFDAALAFDANNALCYAEASQAAFRLGDLRRAREYASRGRALYPDYGPLGAGLCLVAAVEGRYGECLTLFDEALAANWRGQEDCRRSLAATLPLALSHAGQTRDAGEAARLVLREWPGDAAARGLISSLRQD